MANLGTGLTANLTYTFNCDGTATIGFVDSSNPGNSIVWTNQKTLISPQCFAQSGNNIFAGTTNGVYISTNGGTSWTICSDTGLTNTDITAIAISGNNIFVGGNGGGTNQQVFLSIDNGVTWTPKNVGITNTAISINTILITGSDIFIGGSDGGGDANIYISTDNGNTWTERDALIAPTVGNITELITNGTTIFAATDVGVWSSIDNGVTWIEHLFGLTTISILSLLISGNNIFAGTTNGVFISSNNGLTWISSNTGIPSSTNINSFTQQGNNIYIGTQRGVYLSTNNGSNWTLENTGLTTINTSSTFSNGIYIFAGTNGGGIFRTQVGDNFLWNTGATTETITVSENGIYTVVITFTFDGYLFATTLSYNVTQIPNTSNIPLTLTACTTDPAINVSNYINNLYSGDTINGNGLTNNIFYPNTGVGTYPIVYTLHGIVTGTYIGTIPLDGGSDGVTPIITNTGLQNQTCIKTLVITVNNCQIYNATITPGFITFCDPNVVIDVNVRFANAIYDNMVKERFGIAINQSYDLQQVIIAKEIIDFKELDNNN